MVADLLAPRPAKAKPPKPVTAAGVKAALKRRFCAPEWALLFEVGDATGARHTRFADALAMSLWPSRGLELHGMEIKVSRYDWQKERAQPGKAETIAAYCDRWFLVTGPGVVHDVSEIPPAWGWLECADGGLRTMREAAKTDARICDRSFLAALLRRASKTDDAVVEATIATRMAAKEADFDRRVLAEASRRSADQSRLVEAVAAFEEASGLQIAQPNWRVAYGDMEELGRTVKAVLASGVESRYGGLGHLRKTLVDAAAKIEAAMKEAGVEEPAEHEDHLLRMNRRRA